MNRKLMDHARNWRFDIEMLQFIKSRDLLFAELDLLVLNVAKFRRYFSMHLLIDL
ncbi:hypothetical protein D3C71_2044770 [compost metagenome]